MSGNFQSSYTGAQLDAAIASYVNRSTGTITLDPDHLAKSLGAGYYSGVSASLDYSGLTATSGNLLTGTTAIGANGKMSGGMSSGNVSFTLTPSSLSQSSSPAKYVPSASASLDYSSLTAAASDVAFGKTFIGGSGSTTGSLTPPVYGSFDTSNSNWTSCTLTGLTGTPTNIILARTGWQGISNANTCSITRFVCVTGGATDKYHYSIQAYNTYNKGNEYSWQASASIANCLSWNRTNGSVTISFPLLGVGDNTRNTQSFVRGGYAWVVW